MEDIRYSEVHAELLAAIPELKSRFEKDSWMIRDPEGPRQYLVIETVLNPMLNELLDANRDRRLLERIFAFFERMATSADPAVTNLLGVGVFERMLNNPARLSAAWTYMGSESRKIARQIARGVVP